MVEITPFKGIQYNPKKIQNLDTVMSPPYDIISAELQEQLYEKHNHNFVRLILGKKQETDTDTDNRYTRAQQFLKSWLNKNILIQSKEHSIYPYKIKYTQDGKQHTMTGFFALLKIDPTYTLVKAHERTLSKPKADRLNLMRACRANLEPIQLLYIDPDDSIRKNIEKNLDTPKLSVTGYDGFTHTLWQLSNPQIISSITAQLENDVVFIADGHHRYQTAINYAEEQQKKTHNPDPDAPYNYRMVILVNMFDPGLEILPTHRLIRLTNFDISTFLKQIQETFNVKTLPLSNIPTNKYAERGDKITQAIKPKANAQHHRFALYHDNTCYILTPKDEHIMDNISEKHSKTWRTLDVSILHKALLEQYLNITQQNLEDHVTYTRENPEAIKQVATNKCTFSIIMNATKIEELKAIADAGEHMPQKSTYFLPKMLSGLVLYKMD